MKWFVGLWLIGSVAPALAAEPTILGGWHLDKWLVRTEAGDEREFCRGGKGILLYEESGYVSTSINCPRKSAATKEPADDYRRVFFYAGTFRVADGIISKDVANATFEPLIGKTVPRKIEKLTDRELVLSGPFGAPGQSLWIRWVRN